MGDEILCACGAMQLLDPERSYSRRGDIHAFSRCALTEVRFIHRDPASFEGACGACGGTGVHDCDEGGACENHGAPCGSCRRVPAEG